MSRDPGPPRDWSLSRWEDCAFTDSDNDGIPDDEDDCPDEPGPEETDGCPDRDGDGTRDSLDECPDDPDAVEEPCYIATLDGPTRHLPAGAEKIWIEMDVEADVDDSEGYVVVWLDAESGTKTVYSQHGYGGTGWSPDSVRTDVSEFAGETVTVYAKKAGDAYASVDDVDVILDSDGDGLTDNAETSGFRTNMGEWVTTDPFSEDTDADGLSDPDEIGVLNDEYDPGAYYYSKSDPRDPDTDRDAVDDYGERRVWFTDATEVDTEEDGWNDLVDPDPNEENTPPGVDIQTDTNYYDEVTVTVTSDVNVESVVINAFYQPPRQNGVWRAMEPTSVTRVDADTWKYTIPVDEYAELTLPTKYWVNVTDENGGQTSVLIGPEDGGTSATVEKVEFTFISPDGGAVATGGIVTGGAFKSPAGFIVAVTALVITGTIVGEIIEYETTTTGVSGGELEHIREPLPVVPSTDTLETYPAHDTPFDVPVRLPSGRTYKPAIPLGDGHDRGFGWEIIKETPGIDEKDDMGGPERGRDRR